ncbi:MAG TPA: peptidoglycan recognition family protein [Tepidisphaeraceae bacterium]|jgi:N-acetyl-anhydromuramyl-L-alanine amidase AmpD
MAKYWALLALPLFLSVGCHSSQTAVTSLPAPSFAGPNIAKPVPPPTPAAPAAPLAAAPSGPRDWAPKAPARPWRWIVIHHSASPSGSMNVFDKEHKAKGWDGVGYHFVIGNGTNSTDGQVEVTPRWPIQKWGAHAKTADNKFNEYGIGICMVGNFDVEHPTSKQLASLARLVAYLSKTYHIPTTNVIGHRDTKPTDCPGRYVNMPTIRQMAQAASKNTLAEGNAPLDKAQSASVELLKDVVRP